MSDKTLTCRDCGASFVFTESEQAFYSNKGFTNEPSRCPECRAARKRSQGAGSSGGFGERRERQMFPAVCAECGQQTQVPFEPRGDRPVYCSACFESQRSNSSRW
jgi:CxxC-x17-CxxC domain-containing protein